MTCCSDTSASCRSLAVNTRCCGRKPLSAAAARFPHLCASPPPGSCLDGWAPVLAEGARHSCADARSGQHLHIALAADCAATARVGVQAQRVQAQAYRALVHSAAAVARRMERCELAAQHPLAAPRLERSSPLRRQVRGREELFVHLAQCRAHPRCVCASATSGRRRGGEARAPASSAARPVTCSAVGRSRVREAGRSCREAARGASRTRALRLRLRRTWCECAWTRDTRQGAPLAEGSPVLAAGAAGRELEQRRVTAVVAASLSGLGARGNAQENIGAALRAVAASARFPRSSCAYISALSGQQRSARGHPGCRTRAGCGTG